MTWKALDLFCCAGGMSEGLRRAGFEVTGVDIRDLAKHYRGGTFVRGDALTYPLDGYSFVHASPPCQAHSSLHHLHPDREYPDLIEPVRERLKAWGGAWSIENVPGAPLGGAYLVVLCGTMFGLVTPDRRAEIRRHRLFELSFCPDRQPPRCRHGGGAEAETGQGHLFGPETYLFGPEVEHYAAAIENREPRKVLTVTGHTPVDNEERGNRKRRAAMSVTGAVPQRHTSSDYGKNITRETFSVDDARAAMGIDWMPMKYLSQAIPPAYGFWIGERAIRYLESRHP